MSFVALLLWLTGSAHADVGMLLVDWRRELALTGQHAQVEASFDALGRQGLRYDGELAQYARFSRADGTYDYRLVSGTPSEAALRLLSAAGWRYRDELDGAWLFERAQDVASAPRRE